MDHSELLSQVNIERIYQHVLVLEGERHPIRSPERLENAAAYIHEQLASCLPAVRNQQFQVTGWGTPFVNIEGRLGSEAAPAAVLIAHYDTFYKSAGANDNAAAVGVMLELARLLAMLPEPPSTLFTAVSLEETNPTLQLKTFESAQECGVMDKKLRYTSWETARMMVRFWGLAWSTWKQGSMSYSDALAKARDQLQQSTHLSGNTLRYLKNLEVIYAGVFQSSGVMGHLGSSAWVQEAVETKKRLGYAICLDEIGTTNLHEGSQRLFPGLGYEMMRLYKVEPEKRIGNWAFIVTDGNSTHLGETFCRNCSSSQVDLPHAYMPMPFTYEQILEFAPQVLGSDYAPFWKVGIPALALIDTAAMRNPFGHSMADTIERLDFNQIGRIARGTLATLLDPELR